MVTTAYNKHHWAVVLAGGEGERLKELTQVVTGESRPKQFCPFFGGRSLLAHTRERIAPIFHEDRTVFALTHSHRAHYRHELQDVAASRKIIQPINRGTALAIALCLNKILEQDTDALVAFFPCDHHYLNDAAFQETVERSLREVRRHPRYALLVGAKPVYPEVEYGWIQPGRPVCGSAANPVCRVSRFWEKPTASQAEFLLDQGCLWNTFVIIGFVRTFLEMISASLPELVETFHANNLDGDLDRFYRTVPPMDFSKSVLSEVPHRLLVIEDAASGWTDLGNTRRLVEALTREGRPPDWITSNAFTAEEQHRNLRQAFVPVEASGV